MSNGDVKQDATQQILSRLGALEHKVEDIRQTHGFSLRLNKDRVFNEVQEIFKNSERKAQVYLAANGQRSVNEIAAHLRIKRQHVGRALKTLNEENLLECFSLGNVDIYRKTPVDRLVGITRFLMESFSLDADGTSRKAKKNTKKQRS